jgi:hypothetical protein
MERDEGGKLTGRSSEQTDGRARRDAPYSEIARDMVPRIQGEIRPVLHRSQALRMSRDKRRSRGEKV